MTLSNRHAAWLVVILAAALLPAVLEAVQPRRHDDCRHPDMLALTLPIPGSRPARGAGRRPPPPNADDFALWTEGEVANPEAATQPLRFWILRAYDPGAVSPRRVLRDAFDPESHAVREVASEAGPIAVHVAVDRTRSPGRLVAWAWVYDGRPAADLFPAMLSSAPRRLLAGAVPVTLFLVDGNAGDPDSKTTEETATRWIADAWTHMARYCR